MTGAGTGRPRLYGLLAEFETPTALIEAARAAREAGYRKMDAYTPYPVHELTVLFAAIAAVLGMLGLNGLPMPYHPVFNVPRFALASRDRFFLSVEAGDPLFDAEKTKVFLSGLGAREVTAVEE